jgi:hypothetical protein
MGRRGDETIRNPQQLEPSLIRRAAVGDVDGMVALYEPDAVVAVAEADAPAVPMRYASCSRVCWPLASCSMPESNTPRF